MVEKNYQTKRDGYNSMELKTHGHTSRELYRGHYIKGEQKTFAEICEYEFVFRFNNPDL